LPAEEVTANVFALWAGTVIIGRKPAEQALRSGFRSAVLSWEIAGEPAIIGSRLLGTGAS
jgi:hypothetical protein